MKISILGAGPVGCYIMASLARLNIHDLYILGRSTVSAIQTNGIKVTDKVSEKIYYINIIQFNTATTFFQIPKCDVVILAVKSHHIDKEFLSGLKSICRSDTIVITLQNGLDFEEKIQRAIGNNFLFSGTSWIKVAKDGDDKDYQPYCIRHDYGNEIILGCYKKSLKQVQAQTKTLQELFVSIEIQLRFVKDVTPVKLTKLALNVPIFMTMLLNSIHVSSVICNSDYNQKRMILRDEILQVLYQLGYDIKNQFFLHEHEFIECIQSMGELKSPNPMIHNENIKKELALGAGALIAVTMNKGYVMSALIQTYLDILKLFGFRNKLPVLITQLSAELGFFRKMEKDSIIERRHDSPEQQHHYDVLYGLMV